MAKDSALAIDLVADAARAAFRDEVWEGLSQTQKAISPKYFYDARGSTLFESICAQREYYLTRTEIAILASAADEIAERIGPGARIVEYGSGGSIKVRLLLDALAAPAAYIPVDISQAALRASAAHLAADYPHIEVTAVAADFTSDFTLPRSKRPFATTAGLFTGSTIGNFAPDEARAFLGRVARLVGAGGALLIGVDLVKDRAVLDAAYNDAAGVTADFNRNLLVRLNRELSADFDLQAFAHRAFFAEDRSRIEMHLVSAKAQTVRIAGRGFRFTAGETIHTENSYKFTHRSFTALAASAGLAAEARWTDRNDYFAVYLLRAL